MLLTRLVRCVSLCRSRLYSHYGLLSPRDLLLLDINQVTITNAIKWRLAHDLRLLGLDLLGSALSSRLLHRLEYLFILRVQFSSLLVQDIHDFLLGQILSKLHIQVGNLPVVLLEEFAPLKVGERTPILLACSLVCLLIDVGCLDVL